ncbi:hypothetical protein, partial [Ilumatobacter sp.]
DPTPPNPRSDPPRNDEPETRKGLSRTARVVLLVCGSATVLAFGVSSLREDEQAQQAPTLQDAVGSADAVTAGGEPPASTPSFDVDPTLVVSAVFVDAAGTTWDGANEQDRAGSPVAVDSPLTQDRLVPESIGFAITDTSVTLGNQSGGNESGTRATAVQTLDLARLRTDDPAAFTAWVQSVGFTEADLASEQAETAVITMTIGDDNAVATFSIRIEPLDRQVSYERSLQP